MKNKINDILLSFQNNKIDVGEAANQLVELFSVDDGNLMNVKIGDHLRCDEVFSQSKKYHVGGVYKVIKEKMHWGSKFVGVRDDRNRLSWIHREGISSPNFTVIKFR